MLPKKTRLQETGRVNILHAIVRAIPIQASSARYDSGHGVLMPPTSEASRCSKAVPGEMERRNR